MLDVFALLKDYKKISIIGMEKNVGKTTLLNFLLENIGDKRVVGLTSIGRDGEEVDVVTTTSKPKIFVRPNTIVATARDNLRNCDITKEILYTTDFSTPMGNIVIIRAISGGYVDIAGPSYNAQSKKILELMEKFGSELSIIDGALSRKGSAMSDVTDATILSTGASLSLDMSKVVEETKTTEFLLRLPAYEDEEIKEIIKKEFLHSRVLVFYKDKTYRGLESLNSIDSASEIKNYFNEDVKVIAVRGAITQKFLDTLVKNRENFKDVILVTTDGTRVFTDFITLKKLENSGIKLMVLNPINLLFVTCNPRSPLGYEFPKEKFKSLLQENLSVEVIDVVGERL